MTHNQFKQNSEIGLSNNYPQLFHDKMIRTQCLVLNGSYLVL